MLATETIRQTSSRWDEWVQMAKTFLSNITPKFSFGTDPMNDFSLSFAWNPKDNPEREILQLPEKIAEKKGIKIVVCFDEFQQIADFKDFAYLPKETENSMAAPEVDYLLYVWKQEASDD